MMVLFTIIICKRLFSDSSGNINKLLFHLTIIALVMISLKLHKTSEIATRLVPLMIGVLSYYGHTRFLLFNKNRGIFNRVDATGQTIIQMDINELFHTIVVFGAFFINHIYVDIFLTVKHIDSLVLNAITWGFFFFNTFTQTSKLVPTHFISTYRFDFRY